MQEGNEIYKNAEGKSINRTKIAKKARKKAIEAYEKGRKAGVIIGLCVGLSGAIIYNKAVDLIDNIHYDSSYTQDGRVAVKEETFLVNTEGDYDYDMYGIANRLSESDGDFDANLYGVYNNIGWDESSRLSLMDEVMKACKYYGLTGYETFTEYCQARGYCDEDGKINTSKYERGMREYINNLEDLQEVQDAINGVRR